MKTKKYVVAVSYGSRDELRIRNHLESRSIEYSTTTGIFNTVYIGFETDKTTWKSIKKSLDLVVETVNCRPNLEGVEA